eukprot:COSAG05_NODE_1002_length_6238_cov_4.988597_1_plen_73_part_00
MSHVNPRSKLKLMSIMILIFSGQDKKRFLRHVIRFDIHDTPTTLLQQSTKLNKQQAGTSNPKLNKRPPRPQR